MNIGALSNVVSSVQKVASNTHISPDPPAVPMKSAPVTSVEAAPESAPVPTASQVAQAVQTINKSMQSMSRGLEFSVDEDNSQIIVKVVDQQTKELIRQIPSQEALDIAKALEQGVGTLIRQKA